MKSWPAVGVKDVLLYGSTLTENDPRDIDLVIFHNGRELAEFESPRYAAEGTKEVYDAPMTDLTSRRLDSFQKLLLLGYQSNILQRVARLVGERIERLDAGSESEARVKQSTKYHGCSEEETAAYLDLHGVNNVFDIHVLHTGLLGSESRFETARKTAISSCRDPQFWHRVLSKGQLYNHRTDDFTLTVEDKYPGALELFQIQQ